MHVITHIFAGWMLGERVMQERKDVAIITWSGVAPDLDGLGMAVDYFNYFAGLPVTTYYDDYHHYLGHGLPAAIVIALVAMAFARDRWRVFAWSLLAVHIHFIMDLLGSRGSNPNDFWGSSYFSPFSDVWVWLWKGQWPLTSWQNTSFSIALMVYIFWRAAMIGFSPVSLFSQRADKAFVAALRSRLGVQVD